MPDLRLRYFDFRGGRGEAARLALAIGGVAFEEDRIPVADWPKHQAGTRFRALPILEIDGEPLTQSNAINRYVGRLAGLYPEDALEAARCDEVMDAVEDIVTQTVATFGLSGDALKEARGALVTGPLELYLARLEAMLVARGGAFFADGRLTVADLKVYVWVENLRSGVLDHVPRDLVDRVAPKLVAQRDQIASLPGVVAYYERLRASS